MASEIGESADVVAKIVRSRPVTRDIAQRIVCRSFLMIPCRDAASPSLSASAPQTFGNPTPAFHWSERRRGAAWAAGRASSMNWLASLHLSRM